MMRMVYMDEAGLSNPKHEPFVVVAGIIVHADNQLVAVSNYLKRLVARHIPIQHQEGFVFHAKEIFHGGKTINRKDLETWPVAKRFAIAADLAEIPRKFNLPIALGFVERSKFPQTFALPEKWTEADRTVAAHVTAHMQCSLFIEHWMRQNTTNEVCMLVVEDNKSARETIKALHNEQQIAKTVDLTEQERRHFPLRRIKEDPLFQAKRPGSVLEVADFCAYIFKRSLMMDQRTGQYFKQMHSNIVVIDMSKVEAKDKRPTKLSSAA